ncbi:branched-chain amino acid ABC transporter substrate-binding protein [Herbaspirillum huttiense]|jgi:amino acid/amide ABC transporter substrate-binding protein, HAAT family (TC 3.A.1.4.-)|uniref:Branched-chain amino acid ABC transporter substrate-binding protein n=3 Tax=Herbaspirillum TaxID=963 RepID=A0ABU2EQX3_9BURK|nr:MULTISPECIES: branched-chain amino acid ABC transporter substrate-binding protein [Herbaspirillum]MAF02119.1 branched-chain amino acid ABC transporter substrate-binding protein [Herbaspirillum sp.]MBN9357582.1 branched-chain amino acid ABC transporter substrate-binding protein [Herbaspirillum huttiense]MBP1316586.1 branched-chain amino acid transport system substrate-binding protein [Herbaspirillum sp. 1130]MDR6739935.1 branched-chain amino acid transport system substrate-binding protein [He|tara:strand:- start:17694 stop:18836 length:1143 start_codon:yes stop_codon:yes gene_type:complete
MKFKSAIIPLTAAIGLAFAGAAHAQEVVKIAHVGPLSGPNAHMGKDNENGARMAVEELNAKGFTIGGKKVKFELLGEDDASDPKQATAVATKLVDQKVAAVIGHLNSGTTIPASKIYSDAGIPQVSPSATNPKYTQQGFKTTFRVVANDAQLGAALGKYAVQKLGTKQIAVIDDRTAYGQGVAEEFAKGAKAAGGTIVGTQFTNDKATDFNAILTSLKGKKPDVIFFGGMDAVGGPMLRQMKQLGIGAKFMGGDGICTGSLPGLAGDGLGEDQVICAEAGGVDASGKKGMDDFRAAYKKKFGIDVVYNAAYAYDATMTVADAMAKAGSADPKKYLPELAKISHKGVTGVIAFDAKGDVKDGSLTLYTYKGGQRTVLAVTK